MEVIARKSEHANRLITFICTIGILFIISGLILLFILIGTNSFSADDMAMNFVFIYCVASLVGLGLLLFFISFIQIKRTNSLPDNLIIYNNEKLIFADGYTCCPSQIINIKYSKATIHNHNSLLPDAEQNYGTLTVYTENKTIKYYQVENVEDVHNKLLYLMKEKH